MSGPSISSHTTRGGQVVVFRGTSHFYLDSFYTEFVPGHTQFSTGEQEWEVPVVLLYRFLDSVDPAVASPVKFSADTVPTSDSPQGPRDFAHSPPESLPRPPSRLSRSRPHKTLKRGDTDERNHGEDRSGRKVTYGVYKTWVTR